MQVIRSLSQWLSIRRSLSTTGKSIGLIPTMGYLHEGHLSLIRTAREQCDLVVVSIYVNPTQFVPGEDFEHYPRDEAKDVSLLEKAGVDYVITPTDGDIYPDGFSTYIEPPAASEMWCGASRPGHFRGVCTIVAVLFNLVRPDKSYFGRKDAQQVAVIAAMTRDLAFLTEIVVCPTVRESDGLAMSSRNVYLSPDDRKQALILSKTLRWGLEAFGGGESEAAKILTEGIEQIRSTEGVRLDYLGIVDQNTFKPVETVRTGNYFIGAIFVGATRLIDNMVFGSGANPSWNE